MNLMELAKKWRYRRIDPAYILALLGLVIPSLAGAFATPPGISTTPTPPINTTGDLTRFLCTLLLWVFWALIVLAVLFALIAAYRYVTSSGEPEKRSKANKTLLYAAIAVAVAIIAVGVPDLISSFLGNSQSFAGVCAPAF